MLTASKPGVVGSVHRWSALACFLFLLAKALAVVPAAPSLPSAQGVVALRWQDQKPARDAETTAESRRACLAASRMRLPADAAGGQDLLPPVPPFLASPAHNDGGRSVAHPSGLPSPTTSGFSARAPPSFG